MSMSENRERRSRRGGIIHAMEQLPLIGLDARACYRALKSRDARFDGRLFVGVTSTGVYCRPICPARSPKFENCRFFPSAAAAQEAAFRPCLRCRPETAPDLGSWRGTSNTVSRGLALIAEGALDGEGASVDALAERLGIGERQLRRLFHQHLGASPITVAQTRRVLFAKQLIHDTRLPMAEIALASGFGSVRRFNETFQQLFRRPPSALRRKAVQALPEGSVGEIGVTVRLSYRPPYDWNAMLAFLKGRAIDGVEWIEGETYCRTVLQDGLTGTVEISHLPKLASLTVTIRFPSVRALPAVVGRIRRVFDLGADVAAIGAHLAQDPLLAPLIAARPGLRAPGGWDGFELAVRAVLGQQVTVEAGRKLGSHLTQICGTALPAAQRNRPSMRLAFPTAAQVAGADLSALGMPKARKEALVSLAQAALLDPALFQPQGTVEETVARLRAIRGIGDWTAHYIALRAVRETDAFPAGDIGLLRGAAIGAGARPSPAVLRDRAETWRPWRAYAAQHLWAADAAAHG
jgi:AraC family transcriptional regulator of adaptative response / DNA-3-methyladenine glycosylase II